MASTLDGKMSKFARAMQHIYHFPTSPPAEIWVPPPAAAGHKGRYLWTDAFGVLNFITLYKVTSDRHYLGLASRLVETVHSVLGRTRDGAARLPGATDEHPMAGGLRIGKDEATGPNGDGQYHHYLTLWMFALNRLAIATGSLFYNTQAIELARAIHPRFLYDRSSVRPRMVWKMSMDLSHPLVPSEGNLDPVKGLTIFRLLQATDADQGNALESEISDYEKIVQAKWRAYRSQDPLDLGMTLWTAYWFAEEEEWAAGLMQRAKDDLERLFRDGHFDTPVQRRLAFREFGTCLGIQCGTAGEEWDARAENITSTWENAGVVPSPDKESRTTSRNAIDDLLPITLVMYAAALNPGGMLTNSISFVIRISPEASVLNKTKLFKGDICELKLFHIE
jgi:hypothetical protein